MRKLCQQKGVEIIEARVCPGPARRAGPGAGPAEKAGRGGKGPDRNERSGLFLPLGRRGKRFLRKYLTRAGIGATICEVSGS